MSKRNVELGTEFSLMVFANLMLALIAIPAHAAGGGTDGPDHDNPALTWDQFKESCLHPEQFHSQLPPSNIQIQCTDIQKQFVVAPLGQMSLPWSRKVVFAVYSNKYHVKAQDASDPVIAKDASCLRYKEIERTMTIEKTISCQEILGIKSELGEYCASVLNVAKGSNPKLIDTHETGRVIDTCDHHGPDSHGPGDHEPNKP